MHLCSVLAIEHAPPRTENEEERSKEGEIIRYLSAHWNFESEGAEQTEREEKSDRIYGTPFAVLHIERA